MIELPGTYAQINVGQLAAYLAAKNDHERVAAITGKHKDEIKKLPVAVIEKAIGVINDMMATEKEHTHFNPIVKVKNGLRRKWYGFIPELNNITGNEYFDFINYSDQKQFKGKVLELMALMYRPITIRVGNKYQIQSYNPENIPLYIEDIKRMPASTFSGALLFFSSLSKELRVSTLESLSAKMRKVNRDLLDNL